METNHQGRISTAIAMVAKDKSPRHREERIQAGEAREKRSEHQNAPIWEEHGKLQGERGKGKSR